MICRIRPFEAGDAEALWQAARESVAEVFPWLPWCHPEYSIGEAIEWATSRARLAAEGVEFTFVVVDSDGRFLGSCGVNQINQLHRFGNLGYWVRTSAAGRGVACEAARQMAQFVYRSTDLVRLEIVCAVENRRSQRVAERVGAEREGVLRSRLQLHGETVDAVMYSLTRRE